MILTDLAQANYYAAIHPGIAQGIDYLRSGAWQGKAPGRHDIEGDDLYAMIQEYQTIPVEEGRWEAHRVYADIQFVVSGSEQMGCGELATFTQITEYSAANDVYFFDGNANFFEVRAGMFAVFFPHDVHMPKILVAEPAPLKKVVLKVRLSFDEIAGT